MKEKSEKGKKNGRNPTRCPSRDSNRSSTGDSKGAKGRPTKETHQIATSSCRENTRIFLVIIGIFLSVPNTELKRGANSATNAPFYMTKTKNRQGKKQKRDSKPDKATSSLVKSTQRQVEMYFAKNNFSLNQRMDLRTRHDLS